MKLLIVEDQKELAESICSYLSHENFACEMVYDFPMAMEKVQFEEYACIILDITLPLGNGLAILKELRARDKADGVLIISARNSPDDKVIGLNLGADDYLAKPFHMPELAARVAAIIRRKSFGGKNKIVVDRLSLDLHDRIVKGANGVINLTKKEYELLVYFISNKGRIIAKEAIVEYLWGESIDIADNYDFVYTHIKNLRRKLMFAGCPDYIKAVYGMGYKFATNANL